MKELRARGADTVRIGVDGCCWRNPRGYGRYARELLRTMVSLAPGEGFEFHADTATAARLDEEFRGRPGEAHNVRVVPVALRVPPVEGARAGGNRSPADMLRLTRSVGRRRPDVFFAPSVYTYFPLPPGTRAVVAVHDAIAERFPELTLPSWRDRLFWRLKVGLALRQADLVLTVSEYAARQIEEVLGVSPTRIRIAGEAPAAAFRPTSKRDEVVRAARSAGVPDGSPWLVYVGGFNPHKRLDVLVRAHAGLVERCSGSAPHLLLVGSADSGGYHADVDGIRSLVRACGTERLVHWTGYLPDERLRHLHTGALALVLPSESEGFGLPAVEAAACGSPVVATTESPLPELLRGGGFFVRPGDEQGLGQALSELYENARLREEMGRRARERAQDLSWSRAAESALTALQEVAA